MGYVKLTQKQIEEEADRIAAALGKQAMMRAFAIMDDVCMLYPAITEQPSKPVAHAESVKSWMPRGAENMA